MTDSKTSLKERLVEAAADPESPLFGSTISNFADIEGLISVSHPKKEGVSVFSEVLNVMATAQEEHTLIARIVSHYQKDVSPKTLLAFRDMMGKELTPSQKKWIRDEARRLGIA